MSGAGLAILSPEKPDDVSACFETKRSPHDQSLFVIGGGNPHLEAAVLPPPKPLKKTTGKKHESGVDFNILTSEYINSDGGRNLAVKDNAIRERASLRTGRLYQKSHSVKHDIITGMDLQRPCTVQKNFEIRAPWE